MSNSELAIQAVHRFVDAFNRSDKDALTSCLHFPHATHSDGNDPTVYESGDEFWDVIGRQIENMRTGEGWMKSTIDYVEVINEAPETVQLLIEFARRNIDGNAYGVARGIWIVTNKNNKWRLQMRSTLPKSGKISALAGQNLS